MSKQVNYNENLCAGAAIRDDKGRRISKLFESPHPKMTVGYAKNLIMPNDPTEQKFNFRQAGGGVIEDGVAVIDKVKGKSLVWNQSVNIHSKIDDGEIEQLNFIKGHKYLVFWKQDVDIPSSTRNTLRIDFLYFQRSAENNHPNAGYYNWMFTFEEDSGIHYLAWWVQGSPEGVTPSISNILFYDLTQMFGAGNEPATYEEFLQRKPKVADEYAYNEGTIVNNKVEKVVTTGRNLWDEQWELGTIAWSGAEAVSNTRIRSSFVPIFANKTYYLRCGSIRYEVFFYDANKSLISYSTSSVSNGTFTTPNGAVYLRFTTNSNYTETTYNHDICINLSDPAFNGQYAPYEKHELDLAWVKDIKDAEGVKLFEDGMRSAGTAFDEVGKNKAVKRLGVKVLDGSDMYDAISGTNYGSSTRFNLQSFKAKNNSMTTNSYGFDNKGIGVANAESIAFHGIQGYLILQIATSKASSVDELRTYLASHPLTIIYELEEPIEVEYDEKNLTYPVVAGGTEEAIASEPSTAFRADIGYGIDAVKTILDLKARVEALEGK